MPMILRLTALLALTTALAACGGSGLNSGGSASSLGGSSGGSGSGWFGGKRQATEYDFVTDGSGESIDRRQLVTQILSLEANQTDGGAIIKAVGLPPTQGFWDGELVVRDNYAVVDGVITFDFRIAPPREPRRVSTPTSREVVVAHFLSNIKLDGVRRIVVVSANGSRSVGRR